MKSVRTALVASSLLAVVWLCPKAAQATGEFRLKLDADYALLSSSAHRHLNLRPMFRLEQRFRTKGLVLEKVFAGLRSDLLPWLAAQTYYAHKDSMYAEHEVWHMLVFDLIFHVKIGPAKISDRNGNEIHARPGFGYYFYRYRNNLDLHLDPGLSWLRLWVADEVRFDSDQRRLNMNDAKVGIELLVDRRLHLRAYYDLESKRRSKPHWVNTHVFQLMLVVRLGPASSTAWHGHE